MTDSTDTPTDERGFIWRLIVALFSWTTPARIAALITVPLAAAASGAVLFLADTVFGLRLNPAEVTAWFLGVFGAGVAAGLTWLHAYAKNKTAETVAMTQLTAPAVLQPLGVAGFDSVLDHDDAPPARGDGAAELSDQGDDIDPEFVNEAYELGDVGEGEEFGEFTGAAPPAMPVPPAATSSITVERAPEGIDVDELAEKVADRLERRQEAREARRRADESEREAKRGGVR